MMNDETRQRGDAAFEQRLERQSPKQLPTEWRSEILAAAHAAGSQPLALHGRPSKFSTLISQLATIFQPYPKAWAGLAAAWVVILTLHLTSHDPTEVVVRNSPPPSPEMLLVLRQQKLLLAELVERPEPRAAEPPKAVPPRPRSDRYRVTFTA